jgi:hypothetical protein
VIGKHISELLGPLYSLNLPYIEGALRGEPQEFADRFEQQPMDRAQTLPGDLARVHKLRAAPRSPCLPCWHSSWLSERHADTERSTSPSGHEPRPVSAGARPPRRAGQRYLMGKVLTQLREAAVARQNLSPHQRRMVRNMLAVLAHESERLMPNGDAFVRSARALTDVLSPA